MGPGRAFRRSTSRRGLLAAASLSIVVVLVLALLRGAPASEEPEAGSTPTGSGPQAPPSLAGGGAGPVPRATSESPVTGPAEAPEPRTPHVTLHVVLHVRAASTGEPIPDAVWQLADSQAVTPIGPTGDAELDVALEGEIHRRLFVRAPDRFGHTFYVAASMGSEGRLVLEARLRDQPRLRVLSADGSVLADATVDLPTMAEQGAAAVRGIQSLRAAGAVVRATGHLALRLGDLPPAIETALAATPSDRPADVYLLPFGALPHVRIRVGVADAAARVFARLVPEGSPDPARELSPAVGAAMPPVWRAFYASFDGIRALSSVSGQAVLGAGRLERQDLSFLARDGAVVVGRGDAQLSAWIEDRRRLDVRIHVAGEGPSADVVWEPQPERWVRKGVRIGDRFGRPPSTPPRVSMLEPFTTELYGLGFGDNVVSWPPGEPRNVIGASVPGLGAVYAQFRPEDAAAPLELRLGALDVRLRVLDAATGATVPYLRLRLGGRVATFDPATGAYPFTEVDPAEAVLRIEVLPEAAAPARAVPAEVPIDLSGLTPSGAPPVLVVRL